MNRDDLCILLSVGSTQQIQMFIDEMKKKMMLTRNVLIPTPSFASGQF